MTFTSVRDMARRDYPPVGPAVVPDAYPNLRRLRGLRAPLLVIHGDRDEIVPVLHVQALYEAAPDAWRLHIIEGVAHNDLVTLAGERWAAAIARFQRGCASLMSAGAARSSAHPRLRAKHRPRHPRPPRASRQELLGRGMRHRSRTRRHSGHASVADPR